MQIKFLLVSAVILLVLTNNQPATAQLTLPAGFSQVLVAPGITAPTTMAVAPDGRFFIAQQNGVLKVLKHDTLLSQPFITLNVNIDGERGLLGVVCDPDFATNQYIYLCYSVPTGEFNRVSRFTASGDTVVPGSEFVLLDLDTLIANYHGGGHLDFGPDGKLYIAAGDNGRSWKSQDLNSYLGKILRINKDGSTPVDNPFFGIAKTERIWAYGFRNPFTYSFEPGTGRAFVDDVGDTTWEEINDMTLGGGNYGWPHAEGFSSDTSYDNPFFAYHHGPAIDQGCAITGGTFFNPDTTNYPAIYRDHYFYIDYCGNYINMISLTTPPVWSNFGTNIANYSVGLMTGPDGNLYFLSRNNEALYKIAYTTVPSPVVVNQPQSQTISVNYPVTFSVSASGTPPFSYQWRKDTTILPNDTLSSLTIPAVAFSDSGDYNVIVMNAFGSDTSNNAHLTVTSNQPPHGVINLPLPNTYYTAGDIITFDGSATDPEDGVLQDSAFAWAVVFHHEQHVHPGPNAGSGIHSGTFPIANVGEISPDVFYRLYLIVHDSQGAIDSQYVDLLPRLSQMIITTQPPGLSLNLDGQPMISPDTVIGVEGMYRMIEAPVSQSYGQTTMVFTHWSNGGPLTQTFTTPVNDSSWTAYYDSLQLSYTLANDTLLCTTDTLVLDAGSNYSTYAWTDGSVNEFLYLYSSVADTITVGVTVTDSNGAAGNDSVTVIFDVCNATQQLPIGAISIYPVPSTGEITVGEVREDYFLSVIDLTGRPLVNREFVPANKSRKIHLQPGIYSLVFSTKNDVVLYRKNVVVIR